MRRRRAAAAHASHERWLVSYADFITLLFAFFTTLYAISTVDLKKASKFSASMQSALNVLPPNGGTSGKPSVLPPTPAATPPAAKPAIMQQSAGEELRSSLEHLGDLPALQGRLEVHSDPRGVVLSLAEAGAFGSGSADLLPAGRAALSIIGRELAARGDVDVIIEGHSDNIPVHGGKWPSNWELSTARATQVVALFVNNKLLDAAQLSAAGYAEFRPMASNDTAEGRARNRRVDIVVSPAPSAVNRLNTREGQP